MSAGNSRTHGGHQVAQKLITTTLPLLSSTSARTCFAVTVRICGTGDGVGCVVVAVEGLACFVVAGEETSRSSQAEAAITTTKTAAAARPAFTSCSSSACLKWPV